MNKTIRPFLYFAARKERREREARMEEGIRNSNNRRNVQCARFRGVCLSCVPPIHQKTSHFVAIFHHGGGYCLLLITSYILTSPLACRANHLSMHSL